MFSRSFKEGDELARSSTPYEVPLPDDDPDAMSTLCNILHHNTDCLSFSDDADKLIELVATIDKYDCAKASKIYVVPWIDEIRSPSLSQMADLLGVSHILRDNNNFRKFSSMLLHSDHGVKTLREFQIKETRFPLDICDSLANRRLELDRWLVHELSMPLTDHVTFGAGKWNLHTTKKSKCEDRSVVEYLRALKSNGLWHIEPPSWDFYRTMEALSEFHVNKHYADCCSTCCIYMNDHIASVTLLFKCMLDEGVEPAF